MVNTIHARRNEHLFEKKLQLPPVSPNAQCTPTDWQSAVGDIANCSKLKY